MFEILNWNFNEKSNGIDFFFSCGNLGVFQESIIYPERVIISDYIKDKELHDLINLAAICIGASYYKINKTFDIHINNEITQFTKTIAEELYAYELSNHKSIDVTENSQIINIKSKIITTDRQTEKTLKMIDEKQPVLAFCGGKNSHTSLEILLRLKKHPILASVISHESERDLLLKMTNKEITFIKRKIDEKIAVIDKSHQLHNIYINNTAINSSIISILSYCINSKWVVFSNERMPSSSEIHNNNTKSDYHFSKTLRFEYLFRNALNEAVGGKTQYFSLLRGFSELWVAAFIAREADNTYQYFSNCDKKYTVEKNKIIPHHTRWCGNCYSCVHTAIILAPHMDKRKLVEIFSTNILDHKANIEIAKDLCGLSKKMELDYNDKIIDIISSIHYMVHDTEWKDTLIAKSMKTFLDRNYSYNSSEEHLFSSILSRSTNFLPFSLFELISLA